MLRGHRRGAEVCVPMEPEDWAQGVLACNLCRGTRGMGWLQVVTLHEGVARTERAYITGGVGGPFPVGANGLCVWHDEYLA